MKCSYVANSDQPLKKQLLSLKSWQKKRRYNYRVLLNTVSAIFETPCTQYLQENLTEVTNILKKNIM